MNELERLKRRRESWRKATGPRWVLEGRDRIIRQLDAEIAAREAIERGERVKP